MRIYWGVLVLFVACGLPGGVDGGVSDGGHDDAGTLDSGVPDDHCPPTQHNFGECGLCVESLADYCARTSDCVPLNSYDCPASKPTRITTEETGCGYVRFKLRGDVGDESGRVYDADSGVLLYVWSNGAGSVGCRDANHSGDEPSCPAWSSSPCQ